MPYKNPEELIKAGEHFTIMFRRNANRKPSWEVYTIIEIDRDNIVLTAKAIGCKDLWSTKERFLIGLKNGTIYHRTVK